jgi:hypothetical protein
MARKKQSSAQKMDFRALTRFDRLLPNHASFLIDDDASEPHLRRSEYAIIDKTDRSPTHGELYLIQFSDHGRKYVKQLKADQVHFANNAEPCLAWWVDDLRGFRPTNEMVHGVPVFAGLSEGPYEGDEISSIIIGRVVGYSVTSLGSLISD